LFIFYVRLGGNTGQAHVVHEEVSKMPGFPPKDPNLKQRRNKEKSAGTFVDDNPITDIPELPKRRRKWRVETLAWWADVWSSPMRDEYINADTHGLFVLADLIDAYWRASSAGHPTASLATEIRLQRQCFGLTPIDRRRLQWEIQRGEEAESKRAPKKPVAVPDAEDPRKTLKSVK